MFPATGVRSVAVPAGVRARVLVVVPAFNEAASVGDVVHRVKAALPDADVLVIDDGSTDRTSALAKEAGALVVRLPINLGVGGAMRTGFRFAWRNGYTAVVQIDGDGQHDPTFLWVLLDALESADVVVGARFAGVGDYRVRGPRWWAMQVLSAVISRIVGAKLTDATSGYRASNRRAIGVFAQHYPAEYLGDTIESLVIARRIGLRVAQVPVAMRARVGGTPSQGMLRSIVYLGRASMALLFALIRRWPYEEEAD